MEHIVTIPLFLLVCLVSFFVLKRRRLGMKSWFIYLTMGAIVSASRLFVLFFLSYRMRTHSMTSFWVEVPPLLLSPESFLVSFLSPMEPIAYQTIFAFFLVAGSYLWTLPLLIIGSKAKAE